MSAVPRPHRRLRAPRPPRLRLLAPPAPTVAGRGVFVSVIAGLVVAGMAILLLLNTSLAQGAFDLQRLGQQQAALQVEAEALAEQVARAQSPVALKEHADQLGMVPVPVPAFLRLSDGAILGTPTPAPAATSKAATSPRRSPDARAADRGRNAPGRVGAAGTATSSDDAAPDRTAVTGPEAAEDDAAAAEPAGPRAVTGPEGAEDEAAPPRADAPTGDGAASDGAASDGAASDGAASDGAASGGAASGGAASGGAQGGGTGEEPR